MDGLQDDGSAARCVYGTLNDAQVVDGTDFGCACEVLVKGNKKGKEEAKKKMIWRASGCAPRIYGRTVSTTDAARYAQRPSALARAATGCGGSLAIDHVKTIAAQPMQWDSGVAVSRHYEMNKTDLVFR